MYHRFWDREYQKPSGRGQEKEKGGGRVQEKSILQIIRVPTDGLECERRVDSQRGGQECPYFEKRNERKKLKKE